MEERLRAVAAGTHDPACDEEPYGKILHTCVVRDLSGIGLAHLGRDGQEILRAVIGMWCAATIVCCNGRVTVACVQAWPAITTRR